MPLDSWVTSSPLDNIRPTLIERAKKRAIQQLSPTSWRVSGESSLGDSYPSYDVALIGDKYRCDCESHHGGQHRRLCSHKVRVLIWVSAEGEEPTASPTPAEGSGIRETSHPSPEPVSEFPLAEVIPFLPKVTADTPVPSPQHPMFGSPGLPAKFEEIREGQWEAVKEIIGHLRDGVTAVVLDAPTGSGKTIVGEVVRRLYAGTLPSTYMCSTKPLQRQVATDFPYARVLMGRANYPTADRPDLTADDCTMERTRLPACVNCPQVKDQTAQWTHDQHGEEGRHCFFCHPVSSCPYQQAKEAAVEAKFSILNVAYFLAETQGYASQFTGRDLVIVDEASLLESELLRHIEITLTPYMRKELRIFTLPKKTVEEDWVRWVEEEVIPALDRALMKHDKEKGQMQMMVGLPPDPKERRKVKRLRELRSKLKDLLRPVVIEDPKTGETREVPELLAGWVYEWGGKDDPDKVYATFRPVKVGRLAREALWPKAKQFLLMDATPVSVEQLLEDDLGLEPGEYAVVQMESTFPPERRPVIVDSRADMKWSKEHGGIHPSELAKMRDAIDEIIGDNPGVRILVHTVSYALGKYLYEHSGSDRVMTYWSSNERDQALSAFLAKEDSVLLAPSFERGIDLPEEDCRVIVVAKCPFPFLGDARVKKRLYGDRAKGQRWYDIETIRSLVQMTGRGMRHKGDFCKSVLLDSQIRRVYLKQQKYFPQWWRDAVILGQYDPKSQERLEKVMAIEEEINGRRRDRALAGGRGGGGKDDSLPDPF